MADTSGLEDLISVLQFVQNRIDATDSAPLNRPFHCEHDELILCVDPSMFSEGELVEFDRLGFFVADDGDYFKSFRFGSA